MTKDVKELDDMIEREADATRALPAAPPTDAARGKIGGDA